MCKIIHDIISKFKIDKILFTWWSSSARPRFNKWWFLFNALFVWFFNVISNEYTVQLNCTIASSKYMFSPIPNDKTMHFLGISSTSGSKHTYLCPSFLHVMHVRQFHFVPNATNLRHFVLGSFRIFFKFPGDQSWFEASS